MPAAAASPKLGKKSDSWKDTDDTTAVANTAEEDDDGFAGYVSTKPICGLAQVYPDDPRNEKGNQIGILPCSLLRC